MYQTFNHSGSKATKLIFHRCHRVNQMSYSELSKASRIELVVTNRKKLREGTFFIEGWAGALEGFDPPQFCNWGGSNMLYSQPGEGHNFFWQGKHYPMSLS